MTNNTVITTRTAKSSQQRARDKWNAKNPNYMKNYMKTYLSDYYEQNKEKLNERRKNAYHSQVEKDAILNVLL
jgi:hypothetical protein